jgi:hypothetical protein
LDFITHRFVDSHLSSDCGATCGFGAATSFKKRASITRRHSAHLCISLARGELPAEPSFSRPDCVRLFASHEGSLTTNITRRQSTPAPAARTSRYLPAATT